VFQLTEETRGTAGTDDTVLAPYGIASEMGTGHHPRFRYTPKRISELLVES
jgi:hypothetical protein